MSLQLLLAIANLPSDNHPEGGNMNDLPTDDYDSDGMFVVAIAALVLSFAIGVAVGLLINA